MERHRLRFPRLLAAAVLVGCCARLCPALSGERGSTPGTVISCTLLGTAMGQRCQTDPEQGAGTGQAPTLEAAGQLRTEAELFPFPGTPSRTAQSPSSQGSPGGLWAGREGTEPPERDGTATEHPGLSAGTATLAAAGREQLTPAPAPLEPDTAPAPGTEPGGNVVAEGATSPQGTSSGSPSSAAVPGSSPSTLPGWSPTGTQLGQTQGGSRGSSSPEPWAGQGLAATTPLGDSSPETQASITPAADSPAPGTVGTLPFVGVLQRVLSPTGTLQGTQQALPGPAGGQSPASHPWHGADGAWQGSHSAPRTSLPPLGAGGPGDPLTQPAAGTGPTLLPAAGRGLGVPVPTATASTPGVTLSSPGEALNPTMGVLGSPSTEGAPEHSHVPLDQTWHPAASLPPSVTLGSTTVAQSRELHTSPGSPRASPASSSAAPTSVTPQLSPGSRELPGLRSTAGTSPAGPSLAHQLPHTGSGGDPAKSPHVLEESSLGMGEVGPWAVTAPLSWQPGSLAPSSAPGHPQHPAPSQPASSLGSTTAISITTTATTASPALPEAVGMVTAEPPPQGDVTGVTGRPPTHLPTMVLGPPQEPTDTLGPLGHGRGPGSPPAAGDPGLVQPSSSPGGWLGAAPAAGRAPAVFIVEDQAPLWRASLLRIPCQLVLDMSFTPALQDPESHEHQELLHSFNRTVTPLFVSVPGFLRLEVTGIREGSVVLQYDALFMAERVQVPGLSSLLDAVLGSSSTQPGLVVGTAPVLSNVALEWPLDPCAVLFSCRPGFTCVAGADGNATCSSLCHHDYCKNHGICTHPPERGPLCRCPVGRDFWFVGLRCDYRVTQQSLLGMALGILLSIVLLAAVVTAIAVHRFKVLLLEARADQTRSSYRRFCRLDDISGQYWSRSWLPSASSLDNPAFSNSEELLQLQILDNGCCSCREDSAKQQQAALPARPHCQPSFHYDWDASSSSINDPMVDSGKASDISVSSWPMEPLQWTPFPLLQQLSRQRPHKGRRPHSYCEGMELGTLERSWTA